MSKDEDEAARILEDLEKHGFPLEVKTTELLEAKGWEITNQATFQDIETKKYRTVDILAQKSLLRIDGVPIELLLVVECKSSPSKSKPWIFYASPYNLNDDEIRRKTVATSQIIISPVAHQRKYADKIIDKIMAGFLLENHFNAPIFGKLGYISFEAFTKGKAGTIHKATMQVCNAILDYEGKMDEQQFNLPLSTFLIPVIITADHLYTYDGKQLNREDGLFYYVTYANSAFMFEVLSENFATQYFDFLDNQIARFQKSQE